MGKSALASGIFLSVLGVGLIISSLVYMGLHHKQIGNVFHVEKPVSQAELKQDCIAAAGRLGFRSTPVGNELIFSFPRLYNPDSDFNKASVLWMSCHGYTMQQFCAGTTCPGGQLVVRMKPIK